MFYYHEYVNCPADAFRTAANTLTERIRQFGADSGDLQEWVRAQDQVFSNCSGARVIPAPAAPESPEILQKDRAYQIAAAHFYAGDLAVAERLFRDIADDPASHWRPLAPYLIARALLRQGSLVPRYDDVDKAKLTAAKQTLHAILDDRILPIIHAATDAFWRWCVHAWSQLSACTSSRKTAHAQQWPNAEAGSVGLHPPAGPRHGRTQWRCCHRLHAAMR